MPRGGGTGGDKTKMRVEGLSHKQAKRQNIPTAETQSFLAEEERAPKARLYPRNPDLDPQLLWRGKDEQNAGPLAVDTVPIYIQEKIHPKAIIDDLMRLRDHGVQPQSDLFGDFDGIAPADKLDFYVHPLNWSNRMILGDSLLVMNSLAEKEGLRGRVQTIFLDPPYGINFGSNWQASTKSSDVKDGRVENTSREPEVLRAFRDTWQLGIHSYLSYMRDRLTVARALLTETGSIFVQISDENLHLLRSLLDEVFGATNFVSLIPFRKKTMPFGTNFVEQMADFILWYAKQKHDSSGRPFAKYRKLFRVVEQRPDANFKHIEDSRGERRALTREERSGDAPLPEGARLYRLKSLEPSGPMEAGKFDYPFGGKTYGHPRNGYATSREGMAALVKAGRVEPLGNLLNYVLFMGDKQSADLTVPWFDTAGADDKVYVVQTNTEVVKRCILMTSDPGDLVLDPTCGSGTTAYVAEQWGRRWITIDTSRVSLALARTRLMAARFPYYILADSPAGLRKEAAVAGKPPAERAAAGDIRRGFVYERVPHITLKSIANNAEVEAIDEKWRRRLEPLRAEINRLWGTNWEAWDIPRRLAHVPGSSPGQALPRFAAEGKEALAQWWEARRARQAEIDESIARHAETEYLHDRPYEDRNIVRVSGPFTVESLSPHRVLPTDEADEELPDALDEAAGGRGEQPAPRKPRSPGRPRAAPAGEDDFVRAVLENLKLSGVQNTKKGEKLTFTALKPWPGGKYIHAEGRYEEGGKDRRAAICIGPEYGTVSRELVRSAAREAIDLFDLLVVCGFAYEAHVGEEAMSLGRLVVLKARMNQDLHMKELKKTGAGNLFVVFGEPDIEIRTRTDGMAQAEIRGVDVFDPTTGEVRASAADDIACWFIDTDYDEESFFVRHAYFLGAKDPYERLKRTLRAEVDEAAWATLHSAKSRPFPKPKSGRIAVKVINHYGDEVLKVYPV